MVPSWQVPDWHSSSPLQALPSEQEVPSVWAGCSQRLRVSLQLSAVHGLPSAQSIGAPPTHGPPWHVSPLTQKRVPSQEAPSVTGRHWNEPLHTRQTPHASPGRAGVHAPPPLQVPPHAPVPVHSASGSVPARMGVHVPAAPAVAQDWHMPEHAVLQHTPSTQLPLRQ